VARWSTGLYEAVINGQVTHWGNTWLARHVGNAVLKEDSRGTRLAKGAQAHDRRIDLAVAAVVARARACELGAVPVPMIYLLWMSRRCHN